ncbi:hypothetical protein AJ79_07572 [Helicocarpus griseus UAMH5409]|uniref:Fatty acid hydroxylase domain-containing protein n=1 Tax=Helicocarpus griseus UAMH5409 TaxID=1447875 RepID=A0A2B7X1L2_9EURO|nr:hypothetical protein AJ79_07572 [Helicocarpus griseus UAMH5409]
MSTVKGNPKDSMKSTWRRMDRSQWTFFHWLYEVLSLHPISLDKEVPVHQKTDKVPYMAEWSPQRFVISHAFAPIALHQLYVSYTGRNFSTLGAIVFYSFAFKFIAIHQLNIVRRLSHQLGFFDGDKHERDGVPDISVAKVAHSLISTSTFRPIFTVFFSYRASQGPSTINWYWLPVEAGLYGIVLDFWFYWYHRLMHEVDGLWKYHRTHHLTKHPNPLLALYADFEQEIFDIAGIPLMTYFTLKLIGCPMGFYEWWICHMYVVFSELAGHSGLRLAIVPPSPFSWLLRLLNSELIIEDHDIHHRHGWKKSGNYGKQTRLWDRLFGTLRDRIECQEENIDYNNTIEFPLF